MSGMNRFWLLPVEGLPRGDGFFLAAEPVYPGSSKPHAPRLLGFSGSFQLEVPCPTKRHQFSPRRKVLAPRAWARLSGQELRREELDYAWLLTFTAAEIRTVPKECRRCQRWSRRWCDEWGGWRVGWGGGWGWVGVGVGLGWGWGWVWGGVGWGSRQN